MKKLVSILLLGCTAMVATAQNDQNTSIQQYAPQSTLIYATYGTRTAGQTNKNTGTYHLSVRDPNGYFNLYRDIWAVNFATNVFYFGGYDTNLIRIGGLPNLGYAASGQLIGWIATGTSNKLAGIAGSSAGTTTGYTNSAGGDIQVSWYHSTGTVGAGVYSNINVNGSAYLNSTNDSGAVILQPGEWINWGGGAGFDGAATTVKYAVKPL